MGSRSSSNSSPTTTTTTTTEVENINLQGIEGTAVVGGEGDLNFSMSDQGSIDSAFQFARETLGVVERSAGTAQKSFEAALASTLGVLDEEQSGGAQRVVWVAVLAFAAVVGLGYVMRGR